VSVVASPSHRSHFLALSDAPVMKNLRDSVMLYLRTPFNSADVTASVVYHCSNSSVFVGNATVTHYVMDSAATHNILSVGVVSLCDGSVTVAAAHSDVDIAVSTVVVTDSHRSLVLIGPPTIDHETGTISFGIRSALSWHTPLLSVVSQPHVPSTRVLFGSGTATQSPLSELSLFTVVLKPAYRGFHGVTLFDAFTNSSVAVNFESELGLPQPSLDKLIPCDGFDQLIHNGSFCGYMITDAGDSTCSNRSVHVHDVLTNASVEIVGDDSQTCRFSHAMSWNGISEVKVLSGSDDVEALSLVTVSSDVDTHVSSSLSVPSSLSLISGQPLMIPLSISTTSNHPVPQSLTVSPTLVTPAHESVSGDLWFTSATDVIVSALLPAGRFTELSLQYNSDILPLTVDINVSVGAPVNLQLLSPSSVTVIAGTVNNVTLFAVDSMNNPVSVNQYDVSTLKLSWGSVQSIQPYLNASSGLEYYQLSVWVATSGAHSLTVSINRTSIIVSVDFHVIPSQGMC
jgi:hypothetical protein